MTRREFPQRVRVAAFERAHGRCEGCCTWLAAGKFHYDHAIPDAMGGEAILDNCRVLCAACHKGKTASIDAPRIAKTKRQHARHIGAKARSAHPMPGSRNTRWKRRLDGTTISREEHQP